MDTGGIGDLEFPGIHKDQNHSPNKKENKQKELYFVLLPFMSTTFHQTIMFSLLY